MLSESMDEAIPRAAPKVAAGRKWNPREAVLYAQTVLGHRDIVAQPTWSK